MTEWLNVGPPITMNTGFRRSGADIILTYRAQPAAKWLKEQ